MGKPYKKFQFWVTSHFKNLYFKGIDKLLITNNRNEFKLLKSQKKIV